MEKTPLLLVGDGPQENTGLGRILRDLGRLIVQSDLPVEVIWDPSRLAYYQEISAPVQIWAYPAIDAPNGIGRIGGPAAAALARADRVIAYGRWGSEVIRTVRDQAVPYLPHGLHPARQDHN